MEKIEKKKTEHRWSSESQQQWLTVHSMCISNSNIQHYNTNTQLLLRDITMKIEQQSYYNTNEPW